MNQDNITTKRKILFSHYFAGIGLSSTVLFLILLVVLHFIDPKLDPSKHLISEYELGPFGWMMSLAFFSLGVGVLSLVLSTWSYTKTKSSLIGRWWFLIICIALFGAGIFYPYTTPNIASTIHTICGLIVVFSFPIAATLYSSGLAHSQEWTASRKRLLLATMFVWFGLLLFVGSIIVFHPVTTEDKADLIIGWQNRFMMFTYSLWLILLTWKVAFNMKKKE